MKNNRSFGRALGLLLLGALAGYVLGLGADFLTRYQLNFSLPIKLAYTAPLAGWLALMFGVIAFFYGIVGY